MKNFLPAILLAALVGCNGPVSPPEPEPCGENEQRNEVDGLCECIDGYIRNDQGVCEERIPSPDPTPEPEPEPDPGPDPDDYIHIARVESLLFWQSHQWEGLFAYSTNLIWAGSRDVLNVRRNCPWAFPDILGMSSNEADAFAATGQALNQETDRFIGKLWKRDNPDDTSGQPIPNRRCVPSHPEHAPEFCSRTNVRKEVFSEFKERMLVHNQRANSLRGLAHQCKDDTMRSFDSIAGWCGRMNEVGYTSCP